MRIKVCGITNAADARAAIEAGADALGFNCHRGSKRWLDVVEASGWIATLPGSVGRIAVMVDPAWEEALAIARLPFIDALQLHGRESDRFCARLAGEGIRFSKALPAMEPEALARARSFSTDTIVLDSTSGADFGGTGRAFPWEIAARFVSDQPTLRLVLAGGLTPANVQQAIKTVRPFAVDVTGGVEMAPGRKDHALVARFIMAARTV
ncbi:MAG: phosphoribosylanthranilate isomerase [Chthoniobacterales bacterium]